MESPLRGEGGGPCDAEPLDVLGECVGGESEALGGALGVIAQRAQHEGPQAILSLVYGWHVAAGIVQALRQVRDTDRTAPTTGPLDGQDPLTEETA